jgi:hypothetical protein
LVDRTTYARILDCVESGQVEEARRLLEARLALYAPGDDGKADPDRYRGGAGPFHIRNRQAWTHLRSVQVSLDNLV